MKLKVAIPIAALVLAMGPMTSWGVTLNADGLGQALIFPYYTVRSSNGNPFNTYVTIVNHSADSKALRVRFREGRNSREVASLNLFLSPNDSWAAAVIPLGDGTALITSDRSCLTAVSLQNDGTTSRVILSNASFTGAAADGNGDGLERTTEGWIEVLEMGTVTGNAASSIRHGAGGSAPTCAAIQGGISDISAPTGGLSGTFTLINVESGRDFALNAEALADLSSVAFYRVVSDPYPDFNAAEIDPVSVVSLNGFVYRSQWARPVDAVSAVLMRSTWYGEYVMEPATRSRTDFVATFPTRNFYVNGSTATAPFTATCQPPKDTTFAGEPVIVQGFTREQDGGEIANGLQPFPVATYYRCAASAVFDVHIGDANTDATDVLGSHNRGFAHRAWLQVPQSQPNGWVSISPSRGRVLSNLATLVSLPSSTRLTIATGASATGAHTYTGLPVTGFTVRTFDNGYLACGAIVCQGNYGAAFPMKYTRSISP